MINPIIMRFDYFITLNFSGNTDFARQVVFN